MRVLVVATSRKTRGGITAVLRAYEQAPHWRRFRCHWVQTHRDGPAWRKMLYLVSGMADFLVRLPFTDAVHIHTADYGSERRKRIFARITKAFGKKLLVHLHSSGPEYSIESPDAGLYRWSFTHADAVIALSKEWRNKIISIYGLNPDRVHVLYNPCPRIGDTTSSEKKPYILFAGTLNRRKGFDDLLRAFALAAPYMPGWRVLFAGNGLTAEAQALAKALRINDRTDFPGWLDKEDKEKVFRQASAYCLPSYSEGFPMGVLDAWAYGLPVITTPVGGIPDIARDGENLLLFQPGDIPALAACLRCIASDPELRNRLSEASSTLARSKFSLQDASDQLGEIYMSL